MATAAPPFKLPVTGIATVSGPWQALKVEPVSDGDQKKWPGKPLYVPSDERAYRIRLAKSWAQHLGIAEPGINYYLEDLPHGYSVFEAKQPGGSAVYKRLFGHPTGRYYDSILRFETHFLWLMSRMEGDCTCVLCGKPKVVGPRPRKPREVSLIERRRRRDLVLDDTGGESTRSSSAGGRTIWRKKLARGTGQTYPIDEEGTRDVYKECIQSLYKNKESRKGIQDDIIEEDSFDHEAEHEALTQYLTRIEQQHSFIPRLGELVLWCNYFPEEHYLLKDTEKNEFKFYSFKDKVFRGFPEWRAGVVTVVPNSSAVDGPIDFPDILDLPKKKTNLNLSGFRVETIPDPNKGDKSVSKQYRYLPLRSIRPLAHWQYVLHGFPQKRLHPSIYHALTLMTSISLLDKFEFTGTWPNGSIHCKGIYIGSELITIGDVVRIFHADQQDNKIVRDILIVSSIRMNLLGIQDHHAHAESPVLSSQMNITLIGSAYTTRRDQSINATFDPITPETAKHLFRPVGTNKCGPWYPKHSPNHRYEVSHDQVIGRLQEPYAVKLWTGREQFKLEPDQDPELPDFDFDLAGIIAGRHYATKTDQRIPETQSDMKNLIMWHLADYRAQALDIASSNGLDVGPYDPIRTKKTLNRWRSVLKVRRGDMSAVKELMISHQRGRPPGTRVIDGRVVEIDEIENVRADQDTGHVGKRRGRPPGTKIVNGKLVYPQNSQSQGMKSAGREETDSETSVDEDTDMIETDNPRAHHLSGLDGNASFAQRESPPGLGDEEENVGDMPFAGLQRAGSGDDDDEDANADNPPLRPTSSKGRLSLNPSSSKRKAPAAKEHIMRSIETGNLADDEDEGAEWWEEPLPPARGGTEESEGGDYDPDKESQEERAARKSRERKLTGQESKPKYVPPPGSDYRPWVKDW